MSARAIAGHRVRLVLIAATGTVRRCPICDARMVAVPTLAVSIGGRQPCDACVRELLGDEVAADLLATAAAACAWCGRVDGCPDPSGHAQMAAASETTWRVTA